MCSGNRYPRLGAPDLHTNAVDCHAAVARRDGDPVCSGDCGTRSRRRTVGAAQACRRRPGPGEPGIIRLYCRAYHPGGVAAEMEVGTGIDAKRVAERDAPDGCIGAELIAHYKGHRVGPPGRIADRRRSHPVEAGG